jgi:hypothetical protein
MMDDHSHRGRSHRTFALSPRWQWLTVPVLAAGGGTTAILFIQKEGLTLESLGPVVAIPLLGAPILWLINKIFDQTAPPLDR